MRPADRRRHAGTGSRWWPVSVPMLRATRPSGSERRAVHEPHCAASVHSRIAELADIGGRNFARFQNSRLQRGDSFIRLRRQREQRPILLGQGFNSGFERSDCFAVEHDLIAHKPLERAGHQFLDGLYDAIDDAARARIHCADSRNFRLRGIARMDHRHEVS